MFELTSCCREDRLVRCCGLTIGVDAEQETKRPVPGDVVRRRQRRQIGPLLLAVWFIVKFGATGFDDSRNVKRELTGF